MLGLEGEDRERAIRRSRNRIIELIAELVRLKWTPDRPSRLEAVFGYDDLDVAREFRTDRCSDPAAGIWQLEANESFACDATWLTLTETIPGAVMRAKRYWSGAPRPGSLPIAREYLLTGDIVALRRHD